MEPQALIAAIIAAVGLSPIIILGAEIKVFVKAFRKAVNEKVSIIEKLKEYKNGFVNAFTYGVLASVLYYSGIGTLIFKTAGFDFPFVIDTLAMALFYGLIADFVCDEFFAILEGVRPGLNPIKR